MNWLYWDNNTSTLRVETCRLAVPSLPRSSASVLVLPRSAGEAQSQSQSSVEVWAVTNSQQKHFFWSETTVEAEGMRSEEGAPVR